MNEFSDHCGLSFSLKGITNNIYRQSNHINDSVFIKYDPTKVEYIQSKLNETALVVRQQSLNIDCNEKSIDDTLPRFVDTYMSQIEHVTRV